MESDSCTNKVERRSTTPTKSTENGASTIGGSPTFLSPSGKSRYGRSHKPKVQQDFYDIDVIFELTNDQKKSPRANQPLKSSPTKRVSKSSLSPSKSPVKQFTTTSNLKSPPVVKSKSVLDTLHVTADAVTEYVFTAPKCSQDNEKTPKSTTTRKFFKRQASLNGSKNNAKTETQGQTENKAKTDSESAKSSSTCLIKEEPVEIEAADVTKVLKIISNKTSNLPSQDSDTKTNYKSSVKTYCNKRKSLHKHNVVESFGLPDKPIFPVTEDTGPLPKEPKRIKHLDLAVTSSQDLVDKELLDTPWKVANSFNNEETFLIPSEKEVNILLEKQQEIDEIPAESHEKAEVKKRRGRKRKTETVNKSDEQNNSSKKLNIDVLEQKNEESKSSTRKRRKRRKKKLLFTMYKAASSKMRIDAKYKDENKDVSIKKKGRPRRKPLVSDKTDSENDIPEPTVDAKLEENNEITGKNSTKGIKRNKRCSDRINPIPEMNSTVVKNKDIEIKHKNELKLNVKNKIENVKDTGTKSEALVLSSGKKRLKDDVVSINKLNVKNVKAAEGHSSVGEASSKCETDSVKNKEISETREKEPVTENKAVDVKSRKTRRKFTASPDKIGSLRKRPRSGVSFSLVNSLVTSEAPQVNIPLTKRTKKKTADKAPQNRLLDSNVEDTSCEEVNGIPLNKTATKEIADEVHHDVMSTEVDTSLSEAGMKEVITEVSQNLLLDSKAEGGSLEKVSNASLHVTATKEVASEVPRDFSSSDNVDISSSEEVGNIHPAKAATKEVTAEESHDFSSSDTDDISCSEKANNTSLAEAATKKVTDEVPDDFSPSDTDDTSSSSEEVGNTSLAKAATKEVADEVPHDFSSSDNDDISWSEKVNNTSLAKVATKEVTEEVPDGFSSSDTDDISCSEEINNIPPAKTATKEVTDELPHGVSSVEVEVSPPVTTMKDVTDAASQDLSTDSNTKDVFSKKVNKTRFRKTRVKKVTDYVPTDVSSVSSRSMIVMKEVTDGSSQNHLLASEKNSKMSLNKTAMKKVADEVPRDVSSIEADIPLPVNVITDETSQVLDSSVKETSSEKINNIALNKTAVKETSDEVPTDVSSVEADVSRARIVMKEVTDGSSQNNLLASEKISKISLNKTAIKKIADEVPHDVSPVEADIPLSVTVVNEAADEASQDLLFDSNIKDILSEEILLHKPATNEVTDEVSHSSSVKVDTSLPAMEEVANEASQDILLDSDVEEISSEKVIDTPLDEKPTKKVTDEATHDVSSDEAPHDISSDEADTSRPVTAVQEVTDDASQDLSIDSNIEDSSSESVSKIPLHVAAPIEAADGVPHDISSLDKEKSPQKVTTDEVPRDLSSPDTKETSPDTKETSQDNKETSPDTKETSPDTKETSQDNKETSPDTKETSPDTKETSPEEVTKTPSTATTEEVAISSPNNSLHLDKTETSKTNTSEVVTDITNGLNKVSPVNPIIAENNENPKPKRRRFLTQRYADDRCNEVRKTRGNQKLNSSAPKQISKFNISKNKSLNESEVDSELGKDETNEDVTNKTVKIEENEEIKLNQVSDNTEVVKEEPEELEEYNLGDIVWARIPGYPYWPCLITNDPTSDNFKRFKPNLQKFKSEYHVRFFGDNGRRTWVPSTSLMIFKDKDDLELRLKQFKPHKRHLKRAACLKWSIAADEAVSLIPKSIMERFKFFKKILQGQSSTKSKPKTKVRTENPEEPEQPNTSIPDRIKNIEVKKEKILKVKLNKLTFSFPPTTPVESGNVEKVKPTEKKQSGTETRKKPKKKLIKNKTTRKSLPVDDIQHVTAEDENPTLPLKEDTLKSLDVSKRSTILNETNSESDTDTISKSSSSTPIPSSIKAQNLRHKRNLLFKGVPKERICQICTKSGVILKCKGPCSGLFHEDCGNRPYVLNGPVVQIKKEFIDNEEPCSSNAKTDSVNLPDTTDMEESKPQENSILEESDLNNKGEIVSLDSSVDKTVEQNLTENIDSSFEALPLLEQIDRKMKEIMAKCEEKTRYADSTTDYTSSEESSSNVVAVENKEKVERKQTLKIQHVTADHISFVPCDAADEDLEDEKQKENVQKEEKEFKCYYCSLEVEPPCCICGREVSSKNLSVRQKCYFHRCGKFYHPECLRTWPQTQWSLTAMKNKNTHRDTFTCPAHVCHTCCSDDPRTGISRYCSDKIVRCLRCPATYHAKVYCIPAGSVILSTSQVICPRHLNKTNKSKNRYNTMNTPWCFICSEGGNLICCETCPTSVHPDCLEINLLEDGTFICEDCESGRFPLYDEIVWAKLGRYRWWPAVILFPYEIPINVREVRHNQGEFVVKFFGTHDHFWVGRGRVFLFQEGDQACSTSTNGRINVMFKKSIEEATAAYHLKKVFKSNKEAEIKTIMKPPHYIRVKVNKPVSNVRLFDANVSNTTSCECNPNDESPCGPDSDCLNRLLLTECDSNICPAKEKCNNQRFEKRQYPPLMPYMTQGRGWGLKTLAPLRKGDFVIEYVGEIIDEREYQRRIQKMHEQKDENYYFLTIDKDRIIDAGPKGNLARFMNHCCQPNCETQKWTVNGDTRVGLFAVDDIPTDSELTFNYNLECIGKEKKICKCGAPKCSGFIGLKVKSDESQKKSKKNKGLKKKKQPETPQPVSKNDGPCFVCGESGDVECCHNKICTKFYHLQCVNLKSWPEGKWVCPWHNCNVCTKRTIRCCVKCINSYCPVHSDGNVRYDKLLGFVCTEHDPTKESPDTITVIKNATSLSTTTKETDVTSTTSDEIADESKTVLETSGTESKNKSPTEHDIETDLDLTNTTSVTSTPIKKPNTEALEFTQTDVVTSVENVKDKETCSEQINSTEKELEDVNSTEEELKESIDNTAENKEDTNQTGVDDTKELTDDVDRTELSSSSKRKRGKRRKRKNTVTKGNPSKRIKLTDNKAQEFKEAVNNLANSNLVEIPAQNEVKLLSSVPTRHLRSTRSSISAKKEFDDFLKRQNQFEKDLPMRKRTRPRCEASS